ncbi:MAG: 4-alpha-glucanotransferase [Ignavibacteriae bacterium]|nr:4-alpha-glucanotransferase [Ignavibacteriota bacterium]
MIDYSFLKDSRTADKWERFGMRRRAGVAVPLFSVRSRKSIGIGEIPDIKTIIRWCELTGNTILQLLPLNDTGFDFAPYNSVSSFALDPMYLSIQALKEVNLAPFKKDIRELRTKFQHTNDKVDYAIKQSKIDLLWRIYRRSYLNGLKRFKRFVEENSYWLKDYATYKAIKFTNGNDSWEDWKDDFKNRDAEVIEKFEKDNFEKLQFHYWMQWQLFEQMNGVKKYAGERGIYIMGDIPFLVSRDSCDVWANKHYFDLNLLSGAPPDMYFSKGQRWGMPPYNREEIEKDNFKYFNDKLKYAENFYDMFRIDHFVGFFRVWTIEESEPLETGGLNGKYSPSSELLWEDTGRKLLDSMVAESNLLPCAEDLGTVPECSGRVLWEYGVPGIDVQRWIKDTNDFIPKEKFRWLTAATVSTHDSSSLVEWWYNEAGTIDGLLFERLLTEKGFDNDRIAQVKIKLFDLENSHYNRLLWKPDITKELFLDAIGLPIEQCWDLVVLYDDSFEEKDKFLKRIFDNPEESAVFLPEGKVTTGFIKRILEFVCSTDSIFSVQLLQEYLSLDENFLRKIEEKSFRINFPGVVNDENWTAVLPIDLDKMCTLKVNEEIKDMNSAYNRI